MRRARDLSVTTAISLSILPILYVINFVLLISGRAVLLTGYDVEMAVVILLAVVLIVRMIIAAIDLNRQLNDQKFLCESGPTGSAHIYFLRHVLGLNRQSSRDHSQNTIERS